MKIEKINENQIRCTLTRQDLEDHQIRLSELAYGTEKAKELFRDMIQQARIQVGFEVMLAAENYMKGKKSVRSTDDGKERFDNALDALGVLYRNVPVLRSHIDELVDKTNRVRGAKDPNHKDHVDIEKYDNERAREAKMNRGLKAQGIKPQKNNIIK